MIKAQEYLNQSYPNKEIKELNISGWNEKYWEPKPNWEKLTGDLDLSDFPNLEKLDCSYNYITSLNLANCPKLTELKCWDNELTEIRFPNSQLKLEKFQAWTNNLTEIDWDAFNPESLVYTSISNNNFSKQDISVFSKFTNLKELYLGSDIGERLEKGIYNRFYGTIKSLKNLNKLRKLQIEGTEVSLIEELKIISWGKEATIKILKLTKEEAEEILKTGGRYEFQKVLNEVLINHSKKHLGLNLSSEQEKKIEELGCDIADNAQPKSLKLEDKLRNLNQYWEKLLEKQKEDKQNEMIVSKIPLEKLYAIRRDFRIFIKKWGIKEWKDNSTSEISKLQSPKELRKYKLAVYGARFIGYSATVSGTALTLQEGGIPMGIGILAITPFAEVISWRLEEYLENKRETWREFLNDANIFLNNYHELTGILYQFKMDELKGGKVNEALKSLYEKVGEFLEIYDQDYNREIDIEELIHKRDELIKDLDKERDSKVWRIVDAIKLLEEVLIKYHRGSSYQEIEEKHQQSESQQTAIDLDKHFEEKEQSFIQIEQAPKTP